MRICIATDAWHPQINGVVTTLSHTADMLRQWGHEMLVIQPNLFTTLPCPTYPEIRLSKVTPGVLRRLLQKFSPDAVHIATEGPIGWTTRWACLKLGLKFTTSYHTRFPEYVRMRAPIPLGVSYALIRRFHQAAEHTMAAPTIIDELHERRFLHLVPWSRGVDTHLFRPREDLRKNNQEPILVYMGRVAPEKNLPDFLNLQVLGKKWVIGDGPSLEALKKKYPAVHFWGAKQGEDLAMHLAQGEVFIFPSLTDTFGVVLLEANACGVPVAAYPVTGPKYLIQEGVNGSLHEDLETAVMRALQVSRENCRTFALNYSWESCTTQFFNNLAVNRPS